MHEKRRSTVVSNLKFVASHFFTAIGFLLSVRDDAAVRFIKQEHICYVEVESISHANRTNINYKLSAKLFDVTFIINMKQFLY